MKINKIRLHKAIRKIENGTRNEVGRMKKVILIICCLVLFIASFCSVHTTHNMHKAQGSIQDELFVEHYILRLCILPLSCHTLPFQFPFIYS